MNRIFRNSPQMGTISSNAIHNVTQPYSFLNNCNTLRHKGMSDPNCCMNPYPFQQAAIFWSRVRQRSAKATTPGVLATSPRQSDPDPPNSGTEPRNLRTQTSTSITRLITKLDFDILIFLLQGAGGSLMRFSTAKKLLSQLFYLFSP